MLDQPIRRNSGGLELHDFDLENEDSSFLPHHRSTTSTSSLRFKGNPKRNIIRRWIPRIRSFLEHASKVKLVITFCTIFLVGLVMANYWNNRYIRTNIPWESKSAFKELVDKLDGTFVPEYVLTYAPLVYLDTDEKFFPSDLNTHVLQTHPTTNFTSITDVPDPLLLSNLDALNPLGGKDIFLTSTYNLFNYPEFIYGTAPDPEMLETQHAKSAIVVVVDRGEGVVDAFYLYFYSFNEGPNAFGHRVGNHLGDWEHNMIRFEDGIPQAIWYSEHEYGKAFTYAAVHKAGKRPLAFSARGSHANYAKWGAHDLSESDGSIPAHIVFDHTSQGPLWDPLLSSYFFTYTPPLSPSPQSSPPSSPPLSSSQSPTTPSSPKDILSPDTKDLGHFTPLDEETPTHWLYFRGKWGNQQAKDEVKGQEEFHGFAKWTGGPRGPVFKGLERGMGMDVCLPRGEGGCRVRTKL